MNNLYNNFNFINTKAHESAKKTITSSITNNKLSHSYLIQGNDGVGHFAFALDIALILLCDSKDKPACGKCPSCKKILNNSHPDFQVYHPFPSKESMKIAKGKSDNNNDNGEYIYWEKMREKTHKLIKNPFSQLKFEKEAFLSIDTIRYMQKNILSGERQKEWRIVVLCDVDRVKAETANSMLKILEEPPKGIVFLLLTSQPSMILPTIISRCQILRLGQLKDEHIIKFLEENYSKTIDKELFTKIATYSDGSITRAVELAEGDLDTTINLAKKWISTTEKDNITDAIKLTEELVELLDTKNKDRVENMLLIKNMLQIMLNMIRNSCILSPETNKNEVPKFSSERAEKHINAVKDILLGIKGNAIKNILLLTAIRKLQKE